MEKKIRAQPLGTKKNSCTAQRRKKNSYQAKIAQPPPPSKIKWSIPNVIHMHPSEVTCTWNYAAW